MSRVYVCERVGTAHEDDRWIAVCSSIEKAKEVCEEEHSDEDLDFIVWWRIVPTWLDCESTPEDKLSELVNPTADKIWCLSGDDPHVHWEIEK